MTPLVDCPPDTGSARDEYFKERIRSMDGVEFSFTTVDTSLTVAEVGNHHMATFTVMNDAFKIDGIRIGVSATLEQWIADALGCSLLTPKLADHIWLQSDLSLLPMPQGTINMRSTSKMIVHSLNIDSQLANLISHLDVVPDNPLICTVGKHWVLSKSLHGDAAENYGWHFRGTLPGIPAEKGVIPGVTLIQGQGGKHDRFWDDYSQTVVLVKNECIVDGQVSTVGALLQDPKLSALICHDGPLSITRQPGA